MGNNLFSEPLSKLRNETGVYIKRCRMEDGGYFFAHVLPSSGMDTFYAVKSLSILGIQPERPEATAGFFTGNIQESMQGIGNIFRTIEVLKELGRLSASIAGLAEERIMTLQNGAGGFGPYEDIYIEVPSELRDTYRAVRVLRSVKAEFNEESVGQFVSGFLKPDGGYGGNLGSSLVSTFYALEIYNLLGIRRPERPATLHYLKKKEEKWEVRFIEDAE